MVNTAPFQKERKKRLIGLAVFLAFAVGYITYMTLTDVSNDINTMEAHKLHAELTDIRYMDDVTAVRIIENRPYRNWAEVEDVRGVGDVMRAGLEDDFTLIYPIIETEGEDE